MIKLSTLLIDYILIYDIILIMTNYRITLIVKNLLYLIKQNLSLLFYPQNSTLLIIMHLFEILTKYIFYNITLIS